MQIFNTAQVLLTPHCLLYGAAKSGKTRAAATAPNPFFVSSDQGLSSIRERGLPYTVINNWNDTCQFLKWLESSAEAKRYHTIVIDDLSEIAEQFLVEEKPKHKNTMQAYGRLNDEMMMLVRRLRAITSNFIITICKQERIKDEMTGGMIYAPMIAGKAVAPMLPFLSGEVYHMESWTNPETGTAYEVVRTKRDPIGQYEAGSRCGKLTDIEFADFTQIFQKMLS